MIAALYINAMKKSKKYGEKTHTKKHKSTSQVNLKSLKSMHILAKTGSKSLKIRVFYEFYVFIEYTFICFIAHLQKGFFFHTIKTPKRETVQKFERRPPMKLRRMVSILTLLVMVLALAPMAASAEDVKLTGLFYKNSLTASFDTLEWLNRAEKAAGVDITWQEVTVDFDAVKGAMFAAKQAPDIMIRSVSNADLITFEGLFADLKPLITEENTPNIYKMMQDWPEIEPYITEENGAIYGLPSFSYVNPAIANTVSGPFWINKQWLDNLGLEMPNTLADLKNVLMAFKEKDANGNGDPTDEIPFDALSWHSSWNYLQLLGAYGIQLMGPDSGAPQLQNHFFAEDGEIKSSFLDDRLYEFIIYMRDLNDNGLLNPNFFTKDYDTYVALCRGEGGGYAKLGVFTGWDPPSMCGNEVGAQYVCMNILSKDENTKGTGVFNVFGNSITKNVVAIAEACADKKAALRFIDQFYGMFNEYEDQADNYALQAYYGGLNEVDNRIQKTDSPKILQRVIPNDGVTDLNTYTWQNAWVTYGPYYHGVKPTVDQSTWTAEEKMNYWLGLDDSDPAKTLKVLAETPFEESFNVYWRTADVNAAGYGSAYAAVELEDLYWEPALYFAPEDIEEVDLLTASWWGYAESKLGPWITRAASIEDEWKEYKETLIAYGIEDVIAIKQAAFDTWLDEQK